MHSEGRGVSLSGGAAGQGWRWPGEGGPVRTQRPGQQTEQKNPIIVSALCRRMCASGLGQRQKLRLNYNWNRNWDSCGWGYITHAIVTAGRAQTYVWSGGSR